LAREVTQIFGEFNVSDFIWLCRNFDFQGSRKKSEDVHTRFDALLDNIITNRELERKQSGGKVQARDLLDMMLDTLEAQNSEIEFTRDHIKALVLVRTYNLLPRATRDISLHFYKAFPK
jgi:hypothetical protein